jgi:hypothetical protein
VVLEKNYKKLLLTRDDLKRITVKIVKERVSKSRKYPEGYKEVQVYSVDGRRIKGGIKQAEDELKRKIWEQKKAEAIKAEFKKNHGGMFI